MVKTNYSDLRFDHIVDFTQEQTIFICCRENTSGKTRLFLAFGNGEGRVYTRNGRADSWEILDDYEAELIRQQIRDAVEAGIAVYKLNGTHHSIIAG